MIGKFVCAGLCALCRAAVTICLVAWVIGLVLF